MNEKDLVVKANELIYARYNLTLEEQRIIAILVSSVMKEDEDFKTYKFVIKDYLEFMGIKTETKYTNIPKICKGLMKKVVEIERPGGTIDLFSFLSYVNFNPGTGVVSLRFDKALKPYLLNLKESFTSYETWNIKPLKSKYGFRLYEILKSYQFLKTITLDIKQLKKMLYIADDKYQRYTHFKKRVLEYSKSDINGKTDLIFTFEEIKVRQRVEAIKFIIHSKPNVLIEPSQEEREKVNAVIEIMDNIVDQNQAKAILDASKGDLNRIKAANEYCKGKKGIKNIVPYMITIVKKDKIDKPAKPKVKTNFDQREYTKEDYKKHEKMVRGQTDEFEYEETNISEESEKKTKEYITKSGIKVIVNEDGKDYLEEA